MRLNDIKLVRAFNAWYIKNHVAISDDVNDKEFYIKNDIERQAYYIYFFNELGYTITTPQREEDLKYMCVIFDAKEKSYLVQKPCFDTMKEGISFGIEICQKIIKSKR